MSARRGDAFVFAYVLAPASILRRGVSLEVRETPTRDLVGNGNINLVTAGDEVCSRAQVSDTPDFDCSWSYTMTPRGRPSGLPQKVNYGSACGPEGKPQLTHHCELEPTITVKSITLLGRLAVYSGRDGAPGEKRGLGIWS